MWERVAIAPYINAASKQMASVTAVSIQRSLRTEAVYPDIVVMIGDGSNFFEQVIKDAFSNLKMVTQKDPFSSPACGFWLMGVYA